MIAKLIYQSRTTEVESVASRIFIGYQSSDLNNDPNMVKIFSPLKATSVLLSGAINRLKEKSEQKGNDDKRDEKIDAIYYLLMSFSHHPNRSIKEAALSLLNTFNHYGLEIKDGSYSSESSLINSLLRDYAQPKAQEQIALVPQCTGYFEALRAAQITFENTRLSFEKARAEEGTMENASALKEEVLENMNKMLVPYLNVMVQLNKDTYGTFARTVAQIIADNNEVVKKRRNNGDEPEGGEN